MGSVSMPVRKKDEWEFVEDMPLEILAEIMRDLDDEWLGNLTLYLLNHIDSDNFDIVSKVNRVVKEMRDNADPDNEPWAFNEIDEEYERANAKRPDLV